MKALSSLTLSLCALFFSACSHTSSPTIPMTALSNPDNPTATLHTTMGDITVELYADQTPRMAENFINIAQDDLYDGTPFHRVIKGFMIQTGDYENKNGTGGQAHGGGMIDDEFADGLTHQIGALSMAHRGPNTNGSQFFIVTGQASHLNGMHSVFGQVVDGLDIVKAIESAPTGAMDKPLEDILIEKITIQK